MFKLELVNTHQLDLLDSRFLDVVLRPQNSIIILYYFYQGLKLVEMTYDIYCL